MCVWARQRGFNACKIPNINVIFDKVEEKGVGVGTAYFGGVANAEISNITNLECCIIYFCLCYGGEKPIVSDFLFY